MYFFIVQPSLGGDYEEIILYFLRHFNIDMTLGHIPAGMELFTSGDESQMDVIRQWIDESDIFLLILGGRYGSIEPKTGKSYIHLEYEHALYKRMPLFSCVINKSALENRVKIHGVSVLETENQQKLNDFQALVQSKMTKFWDDSKDIKITVGETLSHFARRDDLIGWVRANQEANMPALADEMARLSKENAQLRSQLATGGTEDTILGLSFDELKALLEAKDLMSLLCNERAQFTTSSGYRAQEPQEKKYLRELCALGILIQDNTFAGEIRYKLSKEGIFFLNKLEIQGS